MSEPFLPYGRQTISDADVETVARALRDPWITQGPTVGAFEEALAAYTGARHAVAFANGTAALHGAAFAAGLGPGDELLTTPITFAADANCALYMGAEPRFGDIDPGTWNLDTAAAARAATERTKAIVPVSFAGLPIDLEPLRELRDRVTIIEDGCHALGGHRGGVRVGGPGVAHMTVFSFHPVKPITTGEGGAVTTEDDALAERLRAFRTHGIVRDAAPPPGEGAWFYDMAALGFNYRLTDVQSALGIGQLQRLDEWIADRNGVAERYRELLGDEPRIGLPPSAPEGSLHGYHLFAVHVRAGAEARLRAFDHLRAAGIGTQVHYIPIYRFSYYRDVLGAPQDACPEAERYYAGALSLPVYPGLTARDQERVARELRAAL